MHIPVGLVLRGDPAESGLRWALTILVRGRMDYVGLLLDGHHLNVIFVWSALWWGGVVAWPCYIVDLYPRHHTPFADLRITK